MAFQKLKAFGRRKSTGNALEEPLPDLPVPDPQESSFKVIPRTERQHVISFDKPPVLDNRYSHASSAQTRPGPSTAASSVRYSSTSTVPSSFEIDERSSPLHHANMARNSQRSPVLQGKQHPTHSYNPRVDSLNNGKPLPSTDKPLPPNGSAMAQTRDRALTTSSYASTAVPPKLEAPLPALGDNSFDDLENMFAGLSERNEKTKADNALPQPPQRTFQRADSEPVLTPRKPLAPQAAEQLPTILRVNGAPFVASAEPSPDLNRKSTDRLLYQNSSEPSSPGHPPLVPAHAPRSNGITIHSNLSSRQTLDSTSSVEGKKSRVVSFHASATEKPPADSLKPSSRGSDSSNSFNTSALAYAGEDVQPALRTMSQKDYEAMKARENYEAKLKMRRGEVDDDDEGPTIYEDLDDDEDDRRREKRKREKQQADLAVNRQMMKKVIGRENIEPATTERRVSVAQVVAGATPEDNHLLPYAHNLPVAPPRDPKGLAVRPYSSTPNLPRTTSLAAPGQKTSGDEDDEVPLGMLQPHIMQKSADMNSRMSTAGSLMNGSASITPSHLNGASPNRLSARSASGGLDNRPKSRASNASHLPAFARSLPPPDQLPFVQGFQNTPSPGYGMNGPGGYFAPQPMSSGASAYGDFGPSTLGQVVYQDGFTGAYHATAPQGSTFMDTIQNEERRKKSKYKGTPSQQFQRASTAPSMQGMNPQMGMPPMAMMNPMMQQQMAMMQQIQMMQQQMAMMNGMQPNMMGMGMNPGQMPQMPMQQMNMNGQANGPRRPNSHQAGNNLRTPANYLGSLPAIPDASPIRASVLPVLPNGLPHGYAPSIAPSERSNIGMPSRYKPVSTMNDTGSVMGGAASTIGAGSIRATLRPVGTQAADGDADNEGSGWGAMRARRLRNKQAVPA